MTLAAGTRLGPYEITGSLGAGGMGEVYKARDTRLDRSVAIKVLPQHAHADPERRQRFDREARAVSALSHPHICALYDVGHQDGYDFLVMELLEGESLADRLAKGALPIDQALRHAIEIAEALAAAHRQGIVHRDLKPGNVMLTRSGAGRQGAPQAKLLDFGLARMGLTTPAGTLSAMPTTPANLTGEGAILGTFQYMAPEQLEGGEADARTDIFAFGALFYEMLTGRRAFESRSQAGLISAIMTSVPAPASTVQPLAPPALDYAISRCLAKDPEDRWQSAIDLAAELRRVSGQSSGSVATVNASGSVAALPSVTAGRGRERTAWAVAAVLLLALAALGVWTWTRARGVPVRSSARLAIPLAPADALAGMFTLSPDASQLVFVGRTGDRMQLFVRAMDKETATAIAGTENVSVSGATFSPDGAWLAFVASGTLKRIPIGGGPPVVLSPAAPGGRPAWGPNGIVFRNTTGGLSSVSPEGGAPKVLTTLDPKAGEFAYEMPLILPNGKTLLFDVRKAAAASNTGNTMMFAQSLETGERRPLFPGMPIAIVHERELVFARDRAVLSVPFDVESLTTRGDPITLQGVARVELALQAVPLFSAASDGTIVFLPEQSIVTDTRLAIVNRAGVEKPISLPSHRYSDPRFSPDGERVAVHVFEEGRDNWVADLRRGSFMRLTFDAGEDETPIWSPDGKSVLYSSTRSDAPRAIFRKAADGSGAERMLWSGNSHVHLGGFTPDGQTLIVSIVNGQQTDIAAIAVRDGKLTPLVTTPFRKGNPTLSRNGKWLAYTSDESGSTQVYVQPYPTLDQRWQVSTSGGDQPVWSPTGRELFYRASGKMMAVDIEDTSSFVASSPRPVFDDHFDSTQSGGHTCYDVSPDGKMFLMVTRPTTAQGAVTHLNVVLNR